MHRVICAIVLVAISASIAGAQDSVGEITEVRGIAKVERGGKDFEAAASMPVAIGDKIRTSPNAQVRVIFKDGTKVELGESSSFTIDQFAIAGSRRTKAVLALWVGHLRSIVKVAVGDPPNFEVHTPNAVAAVR